jgi:hypothetical protein
MKKKVLKLKLNRETLRQLDETSLQLPAGGIITPDSDPVDTCGHVCTNHPITPGTTTR